MTARSSSRAEINELTPWGCPVVHEVIFTTGGDDPVSE